MKKMPCLFVREFHGRDFTITSQVAPGCEWVLAGEGKATRKWDGTSCAIINGELYKRYDAKKDRKTGQYKTPPEGAIPCGDADPLTGHWPHWVKVEERPEDQHHLKAWEALELWEDELDDGTYELVGPGVNGNHDGFKVLTFQRHGEALVGLEGPLTFEGIREYLRETHIEGIVFHHPDGRMVKIRRDDFGFAWPVS